MTELTRLNRLTDSLSHLQAKISKYELQLQQDNVKLTEVRSSSISGMEAVLLSTAQILTLCWVIQEYTRAASHFQDLQKKARHFTALDRRQ